TWCAPSSRWRRFLFCSSPGASAPPPIPWMNLPPVVEREVQASAGHGDVGDASLRGFVHVVEHVGDEELEARVLGSAPDEVRIQDEMIAGPQGVVRTR